MKKIRIGKRLVGDGEPCYIIAEAGSNHNGKIHLAKKLIDAAARAGADAVKFQLFKADKLYVREAGHAKYLKEQDDIFKIIKGMELPSSWVSELASYCDKQGIAFLASAFDEKSADLLDEHVCAHKIASYECNHLPLIRHVARKRKPLIISTGACTMDEIADAVRACRAAGNGQLALMQCTAKYPAPLSSLNLRVIPELKKAFGVAAGLSDHSKEPFVAPIASIAMGANLIEKHFTLDRRMDGPDHKFALEPDELGLVVKYIRETEGSLGSGKKAVVAEERELHDFAKRAVHAIEDIRKGERFTINNVAVLRPGKMKRGVAPKHLEVILGKRAKRNIKKWEGICEGFF